MTDLNGRNTEPSDVDKEEDERPNELKAARKFG